MIELDFMIKLPDFDEEEFNCPCCGQNFMKPTFLWKLQQARTEAGVPFIITSGYRCEDHNAEVGGGPEHVEGLAADIKTPDSFTRFKILKAAMNVGFFRIGIGENFIHLGDSTKLSRGVVWHYY